MKKYTFLKIGVIYSLLFFLPINIIASNFILNHDGLIDPRAISKIEEIGTESKNKLGVNIYVYAKQSLGLVEKMPTKEKIDFIKNYEATLLKDLIKPYVLLTMAVEDTHVNLIISSSLKQVVDKNEILNDYVVPLLASKDKNSTYAKASASILNGYAAISDTIAKSKNIKLESSIGSSGKVTGTIWRVFMYTLIVVGLLFYIYAVLKRKK
ncbi:MAG: hypothetical protein GY932_11845 [Arcobacter sp.]|nr:hypothetical protein [Arcobacter sp.]